MAGPFCTSHTFISTTVAALKIADRAYVMELGEFILSGSAKDIASNQRVPASYLGFQHEGASEI
jgi:branched-chain amino acid transport system ATP-binding protein